MSESTSKQPLFNIAADIAWVNGARAEAGKLPLTPEEETIFVRGIVRGMMNVTLCLGAPVQAIGGYKS